MRNQIIATAKAWLGCNEADGTHKPIIDTYNSIKPLPAGYKMTYTDPWCAAFVSAVAHKCGITSIVYPECSCDRMISLYKKAGCWVENDAYKPQPGDIIFYDWQDTGAGDNAGSSDHVGIVTAVSGNTITVIEGNISDKVGYRTIAVNGRYIRGYGVPNYDGTTTVPTTGTSAATTTAKVGKEIQITLNQLSLGDKGEQVKTAQRQLIGRGFSCGPDGADGDFGSNTQTAVKNFQQKNGLTADGIIGAQTWAKLLKC